MIAAAGILFVTRDGKALYLQRSAEGDHAGEWCFPGGKIEDGETAEQAAEREAREEAGPVPKGDRLLWTRRADGMVDFTTFIQRVDAPFEPKLDREHTAYAWAPLTQPPEPLHPGCRIALARFDMNELDIARAIAAGELTSPQKYENVWLFALRITGTGAAFRNAIDEYVWRDPSIYLNDEFLARCNGLAVIVDHPKHSLLDGKEYADRNVGSIMLSYIKGDEVWGIAKIYEAATATILQEEQYSTSPGIFKPGGISGTSDDGKKLLIEGPPKLFDHIAICANGVWDKGGPPTGVASVTAEDRTDMAEDNKTEDRKDASSDIMTKLDGIMTKLDSAHTRLDAMEMDKSRKDAEEREKAEREDKARKDAESEAAEEKRQAAELEKLAAEERKEGEKKDSLHRRDGEDCMDHSKRIDAMAKKHRHDRMARRDSESEEEHSKRLDAHYRHDAETAEEKRALAKANEEREDKARKDAEEKEEMERKDAARADAALAQENAELKQRLAAVEGTVRDLTRETPAEERDALAAAQARADSVAALFGDRVSAPNPGETALGYRRRLLQKFIGHSTAFKDASLGTADSATLSLIENQVYADAATAAKTTADAKPGILIPHVTTDGAGRRITKFHGDNLAFMAPFMLGGQRGRFNRNPNA